MDSIPEKIKRIEAFLSLKYKDIMNLFYKSENFKVFKENDTDSNKAKS